MHLATIPRREIRRCVSELPGACHRHVSERRCSVLPGTSRACSERRVSELPGACHRHACAERCGREREDTANDPNS
jgi:hypothetical protein